MIAVKLFTVSSDLGFTLTATTITVLWLLLPLLCYALLLLLLPLLLVFQAGDERSMNNLKLGCLHPVACIRSGSVSIDFYYFIQIIRYMFRPYNHLQVELYTIEINMTGVYWWQVLGERLSGYCWSVTVVFLSFLVWFSFCVVNVLVSWEWSGGVCLCVRIGAAVGYLCLFAVVCYNVEDRVVYVCVRVYVPDE
jgi:hypothetical protein